METVWISALALLALVGLGVGAALFGRRVSTKRRREIMSRPFPEQWDGMLREGFPIYRRLPDAKRETLQRFIQVFLEEKSFEGCGGLELTEEMRVLVAGQACLLLLNGRGNFFPELRSILLYPAAYRNRKAELFDSLEHDGDEGVYAGESWDTGSVVLSWHDVRHGASNRRDGYNVVLHEFAHQLDQLNGAADGAPILPRGSNYKTWARVLGEAYDQFQENLHRRRRTLFDEYGATAPEEFFAVATETFFEKPRRFLEEYPELYREFATFYQLDPASWPKVR